MFFIFFSILIKFVRKIQIPTNLDNVGVIFALKKSQHVGSYLSFPYSTPNLNYQEDLFKKLILYIGYKV